MHGEEVTELTMSHRCRYDWLLRMSAENTIPQVFSDGLNKRGMNLQGNVRGKRRHENGLGGA